MYKILVVYLSHKSRIQVPFKPYLCQQFSISYDLYIAIWTGVEKCVQTVLQRNSPDWRLHHACPACTYKLEGENDLIFSMLLTFDGNDSLKCFLRREPEGATAVDGEEPPG